MPLFYADSSALVKLVHEEPESAPLRAFLRDAEIVSCELALTEIPRAIRRAGLGSPDLLDDLMARAGLLLEAVGLLPLERALLLAAGGGPGRDASAWLLARSIRNPVGRAGPFQPDVAPACRTARLPGLPGPATGGGSW